MKCHPSLSNVCVNNAFVRSTKLACRAALIPGTVRTHYLHVAFSVLKGLIDAAGSEIVRGVTVSYVPVTMGIGRYPITLKNM